MTLKVSLLPGELRARHKHERWDRDWYVEPRWASAALFAAVRFKGPIHDPCCGEGRIVESARTAGYSATGSDIADRGFGETGVDFLADTTPRETLVFNPPSALTERFITHALEVAAEAVVLIVPVPFLCSQRRHRLFTEHPPKCIYFHSRRPSMPPGGTEIPAAGGTTDYCWIDWWKGRRGPTEAKWLAP
jgi:hypothetical protein